MPAEYDPKRLRKDLGARIRELRLQQGLTQAELGRAAGIGNEFVSRLEHGSGTPSLDTLGELAAALGVTLAEFFAFDESHRPQTKVAKRVERLLYKAKETEADLIARIAEQVVGYGRKKRG